MKFPALDENKSFHSRCYQFYGYWTRSILEKLYDFLVNQKSRSSFACVELSENVLRLVQMMSARFVAVYGIDFKISASHIARQKHQSPANQYDTDHSIQIWLYTTKVGIINKIKKHEINVAFARILWIYWRQLFTNITNISASHFKQVLLQFHWCPSKCYSYKGKK